MILLISYDLNGREPADEYHRLAQAIKKHAGEGNYAKALLSEWFVDTNLSASEWDQIVVNATDSNDCRMIVEVTESPVGRYFSDAVEWINSRLG